MTPSSRRAFRQTLGATALAAMPSAWITSAVSQLGGHADDDRKRW